mmetsp:Transcript_33669/g.88822  ORF Transcript_33669/g.88822 Transcript_33669/m.88822 type:complete len:554 (+) Transcript_33669:79-1740(+)|eukprot:CAMPEP_0119476510 /NCGR_PEP_ID=MMETSP1344-20130328/7005_1 /TAXON_ID=236787 /ORGANISM="Florenciella parvula, Strain CCMP2471" /LENGTH=553 /DNA_ID=CAMNT_0007510291 /DNA_START=59 /DNA_END=1720 /DNA_ORIENTATION=+
MASFGDGEDAGPLKLSLESRSCPQSPLRVSKTSLLSQTVEAEDDPTKVDAVPSWDGFSAEQVFASPGSRGYTFDDLIVLPGSIDFGVDDVNLTTRITKKLCLNMPFCSSPMDTVTEEKMAIAMALQGGIGFIHCRSKIEDQVAMVRDVKRFENGFINNPVCMSPTDLVSDMDTLKDDKGITGVPVTIDGKMGSRLVGFVGKRDTDFIEDRNIALSDVMTPASAVATTLHPCTLEEVNVKMMADKVSYLCVVDGEGNLKSLTTRSDLKKNRDYPNQCKNALGQLVCGAAVSASASDVIERAGALATAGVDVIVIDSRNGDTQEQLDVLAWLKANHPSVEVIAGNVAVVGQVRKLLDAGADGLRVGMGVGSVSTSQNVKAVGRAQLSAVYHCAKLAAQYDVPVIADGGIGNTGAAIKALTMGASCVMMGSLLAGVEESPGQYFFENNMRLKAYRGMGSLHSRKLNSDAASPEDDIVVNTGVTGAVVDKGTMMKFMPYFAQSVRHGLQDMGISSLPQLRDGLYSGNLRFEIRSPNAQKEGGVHDLHSFTTKLFSSK